MNNKRFFVLLITLLATSTFAFSQSLTFCEKVDAAGNPVNANTTFTVAKNGSPVTMLFTLPAGSKPTTVNFDLYSLQNGKEVYQSTMKQPVNPSQNRIAKQVTFYNEGRYRVYVFFDDDEKQIAKAELSIKVQ